MFGNHFQVAVKYRTFLVEINKIGVLPAIHIVNTKHPTVCILLYFFVGGGVRCRKIEPVIRCKPILVYATKLLGKHPVDEVKLCGHCYSIARAIHKYGGKFPLVVEGISTNDRKVVSAIEFIWILLSPVNEGELAPGITVGVPYPAGKSPFYFIHQKLCAIAPTLAKSELFFRVF